MKVSLLLLLVALLAYAVAVEGGMYVYMCACEVRIYFDVPCRLVVPHSRSSSKPENAEANKQCYMLFRK